MRELKIKRTKKRFSVRELKIKRTKKIKRQKLEGMEDQ